MPSNSEWIPVLIYEPARKEILGWPKSAKIDLGSILACLQARARPSALSIKPMKTLGRGCYEIRLKNENGIYRVFYIFENNVGILVFHSFQKKTQKTPQHELNTGRIRLANFLKELKNETK